MQKCPNFIRNFWFKFFCQIFAKLLAKKRRVGEGVWRVWNLVCRAVWKKLKIAFLSEEPFMEQISFTICIIKQIFGEVFISHIQLVLNIFITPFFWLNCYWFFCKFAGLWACNQLATKYIEESESAFQTFWCETNEPECETWGLNFPIDNFLQMK